MKSFKQHLTELSKKTLGSYIKKASDERNDTGFLQGADMMTKNGQDARDTDTKHVLKDRKRRAGIGKAVKKLTKEETVDEAPIGHVKKGQMHADLGKSPDAKITDKDIAKEKAKGGVFAKRAVFAQNAKKWHHEDIQLVDQSQSAYFSNDIKPIDELSKKTLGSYAKKATDDVSFNSFISGSSSQSNDKNHQNDSLVYDRKAMKRQKGVTKAIDKLTKEETVDEEDNRTGREPHKKNSQRCVVPNCTKSYNHTGACKKEKPFRDAAVTGKARDFANEETIDEKLGKNASVSQYIDDFVHSKNKVFSGDSTKKRIKRALAAYYKKEEVESVDEKVLDKTEDKTGNKYELHSNAIGGSHAVVKTHQFGEKLGQPHSIHIGGEKHIRSQWNKTKKHVADVNSGKVTFPGHTVKEETLVENEHTSDAAHELINHADNHAQLHHGSHMPIINNLKKKVKKGVYDSEKAKKLWGCHADRAAQSYHKEYGDKHQPWHKMFSTADRKQAAAHWERHHRDELNENATRF
jgi:hypothetical protein